MMAAITFLNIVLTIHILAAICAFGVVFAYPLMGAVAFQTPSRGLPYYHRAVILTNRALVTPSMLVLLASGIYLVVDGPYGFDQAWISIAFVIIILLFGLVGAALIPMSKRLKELAVRDGGNSPAGKLILSKEYRRVADRLKGIERLVQLLVLIAVFVMVTKPGI